MTKRLRDGAILGHTCEFLHDAACVHCGMTMLDFVSVESRSDLLRLRVRRYEELLERRTQKGASTTAAKHDRGHREIEM